MRSLRRAAACWGGVLLACVCFGSKVAPADETSDSFALSRNWSFDEKDGSALYARICAACHQSEGQGAVGAASYPSLAGDDNLASVEYCEGVLFNGLRGMPALGDMMNDDQIAQVINYVRTHFGNNYPDSLSKLDVQAARPKRPDRSK